MERYFSLCMYHRPFLRRYQKTAVRFTCMTFRIPAALAKCFSGRTIPSQSVGRSKDKTNDRKLGNASFLFSAPTFPPFSYPSSSSVHRTEVPRVNFPHRRTNGSSAWKLSRFISRRKKQISRCLSFPFNLPLYSFSLSPFFFLALRSFFPPVADDGARGQTAKRNTSFRFFTTLSP